MWLPGPTTVLPRPLLLDVWPSLKLQKPLAVPARPAIELTKNPAQPGPIPSNHFRPSRNGVRREAVTSDPSAVALRVV